MSRKGYYSPALRRDLITRLYFTAKDARVPMTVLADRLMEDALNRATGRPAAISILPHSGQEPDAARIAA